VGRYRIRLSYLDTRPSVIVFDPSKPRTFAGPSYYAYDPRYRFLVPLAAESGRDTVLIESTHSQPRPALRVGRFSLPLPGRTVKLAAYRLLEPGVSADDPLALLHGRDQRQGQLPRRSLCRRVEAGGRPLAGRLQQRLQPVVRVLALLQLSDPAEENRLTVGIPAGESWKEDAE
jgi:hypothetical protein